MSETGKLVVLSAPSGAGKSSLARALAADPRFAISVSHTTRPMRPGEQDGVHYHFCDRAGFRRLIDAGAFIEYATVFGHCYGTTYEALNTLRAQGRHVLLDIDWQGARRIRAAEPQALTVFILPPSLAVLEERLRARGQDSDAVIAARMAQATAEIAHYPEFGQLIVNDRFDDALADLRLWILEGRQPRPLPIDPAQLLASAR